MAFCAKCGASLSEGAAFCGKCGAASASAATVSVPQVQSTGLTSNVAAALTYLLGFVSGIIFLAIAPYNKDPLVRFHAFQSIFLSAAYVVLNMAWGLIFFGGPGFLWSVIGIMWAVVRLAFFLLWLLLMLKTYNNQRVSLPIIGPLAARQAAA